MKKSVTHYPGPSVLEGPVQINGDLNMTGPLRATQFRATADGTPAEFAFTWDNDSNIGVRRIGGDQFALGVSANQPLTITQFQALFGEGLLLGGGFTTTNFASPPAIAGFVHNYSPTGWGGSRVGILQDISAAATLTGLGSTTNGHSIRIANTTTTPGRALVLAHNNVGSTDVNRFWCPDLVDYSLAPGEVVWLQYDGNISRWRVCGSV